MKTVTQWFDEYAESHQNETNQSIHFICVPTIYFTIVAMLVSIPNDWLIQFLPAKLPIITNWAFVILIPVMLFYLRLSLRHFLEMASFSLVCLVVAVLFHYFI